MAQVQKAHVRDALVVAAAQTFAELGFEATTMAAVAERAGSSVGNLYKYFPGKQPLFEAAIPPQLVSELNRLTRARMRAFGTATDVRELAPSAPYHALAGELLDYCFRHRFAVVFVLARAAGSPFSNFAQQLAVDMAEWALEYARGLHPELVASVELRFTLERVYRGFIAAVADALWRFPDEAQARRVVAQLTLHHQGGLKRLFEETEHANSLHAAKSPLVSRALEARAGRATSQPSSPRAARTRAGQADRAYRSGRRR